MELTTILRIDDLDERSAEQFAGELEAAMSHVLLDEGAAVVEQYFVRALGQAIQVGFRFKDVDPKVATDSADFLLGQAMTELESRQNGGAGEQLHAKRISTSLAGV